MKTENKRVSEGESEIKKNKNLKKKKKKKKNKRPTRTKTIEKYHIRLMPCVSLLIHTMEMEAGSAQEEETIE